MWRKKFHSGKYLLRCYIVCSFVTTNRSLQHSIENFYREFPQFRCTELQLKMRLANLNLQLKRVAHEQNTRLAVSSRAQQGSVAYKQVFCEGVLPFEVAAGRPTEYSISSDKLNWWNSCGKICHWVLYGIVNRKSILKTPLFNLSTMQLGLMNWLIYNIFKINLSKYLTRQTLNFKFFLNLTGLVDNDENF